MIDLEQTNLDEDVSSIKPIYVGHLDFLLSDTSHLFGSGVTCAASCGFVDYTRCLLV